jgi:hypothetical protein
MIQRIKHWLKCVCGYHEWEKSNNPNFVEECKNCDLAIKVVEGHRIRWKKDDFNFRRIP